MAWWLTLNRKVGHFAFCVKCKAYGELIDRQLQLSKRQHALASAKKKSNFSRGHCNYGYRNSSARLYCTHLPASSRFWASICASVHTVLLPLTHTCVHLAGW